MISKSNSVLFKKALSITAVLYIISLFTLASHDTLYIVNRILFFVLFSFFLILVFASKGKIKFDKIILAFFPILVVIILSNIWAVDIKLSLHRTNGILFYIIGAIIIYTLVYNKFLSMEQLRNAFLWSIMILTLSASYEYYLLGAARAGGLAENPNTFGLNIVFLVPFVWIISKQKQSKKGIINFILVSTLVNASIVSGGRKILIATVLILIFMYYYNSAENAKPRKYLRFALILISHALLIILLLLNVDSIIHLLSNVNALNRLIDTQESSALTRQNMIETGISLFKMKPVLGYGIDNYRVISHHQTYSHNNYIELLVSTGLIGFCLYYYVYLKVVLNSWKIGKIIKNFKLKYFTYFYVGLILIMEFALVNIYTPYIWLQLITIILINNYFLNTSNDTYKITRI